MSKEREISPTASGGAKPGFFNGYWQYRGLFLMLLPVIIYYAIFHYGPLYGIQIAFKDFYPLQGIWKSPWIGWINFQELFTGLYFLPVLRNTLLISFYKLIFGFPAPIILCLLINEVRSLWFKKTVQTITYLPHFISWVVMAGLVMTFLSPSQGPINILLSHLGMNPVYFIAEPRWFRSILVLSSMWKSIGWSSIVYLAAITNVNPELYEVAELDGAGRWQKIWNITLPSIMPVIVIMFILSVGKIINDDFDQIFNLLNGKVMGVGDVISTYTYREGLQRMNYGYATAVGLFKSVVAFILVVGTNQIARKTSEYAIW
jgi:putative aldouronate transport system permease protein